MSNCLMHVAIEVESFEAGRLDLFLFNGQLLSSWG